MEKVYIHFGSDTAFDSIIKDIKPTSSLSDVFNVLSEQRTTIVGVSSGSEPEPKAFENLIIKTDDYGGINQWAVLGVSNNILENPRVQVKNMYINNPPQKFLEDAINLEILKARGIID